MRKKIISLIAGFSMLIGMLAPLSQVAAISPNDTNAQQLLQLLEVEVETNDPLWNDPDFETAVSIFLDYKMSINLYGEVLVDFFNELLNLIILADAITHSSFDAYNLTEQQLDEIEQAREEIEAELMLGAQDFADLVIEDLISQQNGGSFGLETFLGAAASPNDENVQRLLELFAIDVNQNDPLFNNNEFNAFFESYENVQDLGVEYIEKTISVILATFDLFEAALQIDYQVVQQALADNGVDQATLDAGRQQIAEEFMSFEQDELDSFSDFFISFIILGIQLENLQTNQPYAYGYSDPASPVKEGHIVTLVDDSYNPTEGSELNITWEQIYGPEVLWFQNSDPSRPTFIVPRGSDGFLEFALTVDNGIGSDTVTVVLEVEITNQYSNEDPVANLYRGLLFREPDAGGYAYWNGKYQSGMSLSEMETHFKNSEEYKLLNS